MVQKGPFEIDTVVELSQLDSAGIPTGNTIQTKVHDNKGHFNFEIPDNWDIGESNYIKIMAEGFYFNETTGKKTDKKSLVSSISNDPNLSSVNLISHWSVKRTEALLQQGKTLEDALQQSKEEISKIFGIENSHQLDITQNQNFTKDNALLLLLSGSLMEVAKQHASNPQQIINEIATDFADDGKLSELGDDWFIRMQAKIRDNPQLHINQYAKALKNKRGVDSPKGENLPEIIPLASRPSAVLPIELVVEPGASVMLDGRGSHDNPIADESRLINYTWFRVDQKAYNIPFSDRFMPNPTIIAPNEEAELLFALVVTDEQKLTDTAVIKIIVRSPTSTNTPPVAVDDTKNTNEDIPLTLGLADIVTPNDTDADGDTLSFSMVSTAVNGSVELFTDGSITFTPPLNFVGNGSFNYTISDGKGGTDTATVTINISAVNDAPVADAGVDYTYITPVGYYEGGGYTLKGVGTDPDDDILIYRWELIEPFSTYNSTIVDEDKADSAFHFSYGQHVLNFTVTDPQGESDSDTIIVDIKAPPNAIYRTFVIGINGVGTEVVLGGHDPDGDNETLDYEIRSLPENGTLQIDNVNVVIGYIVGKTLVYKPNNSNVPEADSFTYGVRDVQGLVSLDKPVILTAPVVVANDPPVAIGSPDKGAIASEPVPEGELVTLTGHLSTDDSAIDDYSWEQVVGVNHPIVSLSVPSDATKATFTAPTPVANNAPLVLKFKLTVTDDGSPPRDNSIEVLVHINARPTAGPVEEIVLSGNSTDLITLSGSDPENSVLRYKIVKMPVNGFISGANLDEIFTSTNVTYSQIIDVALVADEFDFVVIDDKDLESEPVTVNLVLPVPPLEAKILGGDRTIEQTYDGEGYTSEFMVDGSGSTVPLGGMFIWEIEYVQPIPPITPPPSPSLSSDASKHNSILNVNGTYGVRGTFKITLTVNDGGTRTHSTSILVTVSLPVTD